MKRTFLTLCIGMIVGFMIGTASGAFANVGDKVESIFSEFIILVNGEEQTLDAVPLVYNGTSYLPVRTMANLIGFDVTYYADSRTIDLSKSIESYISDADKLLIKDRGGVTVDDGFVTEKVYKSVSEIESRISSIQKGVKLLEIEIEMRELGDTDSVTVQTKINELNAEINVWKAEIAELEAQKAELEAIQ